MIIFLLIHYFYEFFVNCEMFHTVFLGQNTTPTPSHLGSGEVQAYGSGTTQSCIFKEGLLIIIFIYSYYLLFILFDKHNKQFVMYMERS